MLPLTPTNPSIFKAIKHSLHLISLIDIICKWSERKRSVDVLDALEDWIILNGKPGKIIHDNGKQFTSKIFRPFLVHNQIKNKQIPNSFLSAVTRENRSI
ncbi:MAG: transposase family protein [Nitrososphaeraceae archaeon]